MFANRKFVVAALGSIFGFLGLLSTIAATSSLADWPWQQPAPSDTQIVADWPWQGPGTADFSVNDWPWQGPGTPDSY
jgi:hypothetical protein